MNALPVRQYSPARVIRRAEVIALAAALAAAVIAGSPNVSHAQVARSAASTDSRTRFDIPPGPLAVVLMKYAEATGVQFVYSTPIAKQLESQGISGSFTADEAIARLLSGTGLMYRFQSPKTVTIEKAPDTATRTLGPVKIEGAGNRTAGVNGSTDATATEGSSSYTAPALTIGGKAPRSLRETPQSVSVLTNQRINDQNLTDLTQALGQSTGITIVQGFSSAENNIYSRGYAIRNFQFDGGSPMTMSFDRYSLPDLAMFDHVEVLRGAEGLFSGAGNAGGTVNLVRKRPLDHQQLIVNGYAGSWQNYRAEVDTTGPLGYDGRLRGRLLSAYEDRDFFYDVASQDKTLLYGLVEADVTTDTLLTLGISYDKRDVLPWQTGLMRYKNGDDLHLPRNTCLCTDWSRWNFVTNEQFAQLEQSVGERWKVKLNVSHSKQTSRSKYASVNGNPVPIFPNDPYVPLLTGFEYGFSNAQLLVDFNVAGKFDLLGRQHMIVAGINWQDVNGAGFNSATGGLYGNGVGDYPEVDVFTFDPHGYPEPASVAANSFSPENSQRQNGAYLSVNLQLTSALKLATGARYSAYRYRYKYMAQYGSGDEIYNYEMEESRKEQGEITPFYALTYDLTPTQSLYLSRAEAFSSQSNYYAGPAPGGEPLPPITGTNWELGWKRESADGALNTSLAVYHIVRNNGAVSDPNFPQYEPGPIPGSYCCFFHESRQLSKGADAEITGQLRPGWEMYASYSFNINQYSAGYASQEGRPLVTQSPKHQLKLWTMMTLPGELAAWRVGGGVNAQTKTFTAGNHDDYDDQGNVVASTLFDFTEDFHAIWAARVELRVNDRWSAALNVNNLLDKVYYQSVGDVNGGNWYGEPRSFMLTMRGRF